MIGAIVGFLIAIWIEVAIHKFMGWSLLWSESIWAFPLFYTYCFALIGAAFIGMKIQEWIEIRKEGTSTK